MDYPPTAEDYGVPQLQKSLKEARGEVDLVTRLLCAICKRIDGSLAGNLIDTVCDDGELRTWWEKHKKMDARREAREAAERQREEEEKKKKATVEAQKASALAKLSRAEKKALGLR